MNKNTKLRKQLKEIIQSDKIEVPKRKPFKGTLLRISSSDANLRVKDLRNVLTLDIKKCAEKPQVNHLTRDISHLQDKKTPTSISLPILPTDIEVLKKMRSTENLNFHTPSRCKRENCLDSAFLTIKKFHDGETCDNMDKILMGNPTGRQDIKELCTWFSSMLEFHQDSSIDTIMVIYDSCAKEIVRQVAVQCIERGELLQILFNYMPEVYTRKIEDINKEIERLKAKHINDIELLRQRIRKGLKEIAEKNFLLKKVLEVGQKEKEKILSELNKLKYRYNEFVTKYNEEEKMWKNKHINLLVKLRDSFNSKSASLTLAASQKSPSEVNSPEKLFQLDANSIINQEIMEYEAQIIKPDSQAELTIEAADLIDTDKLLEEYEIETQNSKLKEVKEEEKEFTGNEEEEHKENLKEIEEDNENNENAYKANLESDENFLPETQETFIPTAEKEVITDHPVLSISSNFYQFLAPLQPLLSIENIQESILILAEDLKSESKSDQGELKTLSIPIIAKAKKLKKKPSKSFKKPASDAKPNKKELELHQIIENLKQQIKEKNETISDFAFNSKMNSFNFHSDKLRLSLGKILIRNSLNATPSMSTPRETQFLSPSAFISQEISPRESVFMMSDIGRETEFEAERIDTNEINEITQSSQLSQMNSGSQNLESSLIPAGCDVESWKAGFFTGFEKGKKEGFKEGELIGAEENRFEKVENENDGKEKEDRKEETGEGNKAMLHSNSIRSELFRKKVREVTRIMQFSFSRPGTQKKQHPVYALISKFMMMTKESIIAGCTLSRKIINKMINSTYMNCINKIRNGDPIESLTEQVYDDFYQKYGLKAVSEKRFIEFISSLFSYSNYRRVSVFIKFLGCGGKVSLKSYSKQSFLFYLSSFSTMINLKVGVMVAFDEIADKQMFPSLRGIECVKEKLEWILGPAINPILSVIQSQTETDSKGVNPSGLIELELVLELIIDAYEDYQQQVEAGLTAICNAFAFDRPVNSYEFLVLLRWISPDRLDFAEEEPKGDNGKRIWIGGLIKEFENKESYALHEISTKCVNFGLLRIQDIHKFCPLEGVDKTIVWNIIQEDRAWVDAFLSDFGANGKKFRSLNAAGFADWISEVVSHFEIKEVYYSLLAWKVIQAELKRIKGEIGV